MDYSELSVTAIQTLAIWGLFKFSMNSQKTVYENVIKALKEDNAEDIKTLSKNVCNYESSKSSE